MLSGTRAALAGGITTVLDMPNTVPPTISWEALADKIRRADGRVVCDVGFFVGAAKDVLPARSGMYFAEGWTARACGLKIYVNETFGLLRIDDLALLMRYFQEWPGPGPIAVHAEGLMLPTCIALSHVYHQPLHICHVSRRSEIELIKRAKAAGASITCEATPHHLWLTQDDLPRLGPFGQMRPSLGTESDRQALWDNLDVIDCFATDHAPHTVAEKSSENPPPGVPGLETMLPLLMTAVHEGRLTWEQLVERLHTNPMRIFHLPLDSETFVEVDSDVSRTMDSASLYTQCGWNPFAGMRVHGAVRRVVLRGKEVVRNGKVTAYPGAGRVLFQARQPEPS